MPERRRMLSALMAAGCSLLLGACGHAPIVANNRTLFLALTEYRVTPQSVRVSEGAVTIFIHNYGRLTHNLVVSQDGRPEGSTRPIGPGQTGEMELALGPGTYQMASAMLSDQALGQYGTLKVTS